MYLTNFARCRFTRRAFDVYNNEFPCPICQRLSNSVLPISPPLTHHLAVKVPPRLSFSQWLAALEDLLDSQTGLKKTRRILDECEEMTNIRFKDKFEYEALIEKPYKKEFSSMSNAFATICLTKSMRHTHARSDDCRSLNLSFQAISMSLQLCQTPSSEEENSQQLFLPLLPREMEVLQALARFSINLPYTQISPPWNSAETPLPSAGLYALAMCLKPSLLVESQLTWLEMDMIHFLVLLANAMPFLFKDTTFGSLDHHVIRLCTILYLVQTLAGLREVAGTDEQDPEESEVQKIAKWVSEVTGCSDRVHAKARYVRKAMIKFLRCVSLFYHCVTDVPLPVIIDNEVVDDALVFAKLCDYLTLPRSLKDLINHQDTFELVQRYYYFKFSFLQISTRLF